MKGVALRAEESAGTGSYSTRKAAEGDDVLSFDCADEREQRRHHGD